MFQSFTIKIDLKGEDADPIFFKKDDCSFFFQSVCDGLGKADPNIYKSEKEERTGAYFASRLASKATLQVFEEYWQQFNSFNHLEFPFFLRNGILQEFKKALASELKQTTFNEANPSFRTFATTLSILIYALPESNRIEMYSYSNGTSRNYYLTPDSGLHQITKDDSKNRNMLICNYCSLDYDFMIHSDRQNSFLPVIILSTSDGGFLSFADNHEFEIFLLESLLESSTISEMKEILIRKYKKVIKDDISMVLTFVSERETFDELKKDFISRMKYIKEGKDE